MDLIKKYLASPFAQISILAVLALITFLLISSETADHPTDWTFSAALLLVYMIMNPIISLASKKLGQYIGISFLCYFLLLTIIIALGQTLSSVSIHDISEYKMIFGVLSLCYFILVFISFLIRTVGKQLEDNS